MKANVTTSNVVVAGAVDQTQKSLIDLLADCPVLPIPSEAEDGNRIFVSEEVLQLIKETVPVYRGGEGSSELYLSSKPLGAVDVFLDIEKHGLNISGVRTIQIGDGPTIECCYSSLLDGPKGSFRP